MTCGRTQGDNQFGSNESYFGFKPRTARRNLSRVRLLMKPPFATRLPLKMLHCVGDINLLSVDARLFQGAVHDFSGATDERSARDIFVIAWLFANEHHPRGLWAFPENGLSRMPV